MNGIDRAGGERRSGRGHPIWLAAGYLILLGAVACMLGVTLVGMQAQASVRVLLQAESQWSLDTRDAVIHLRTYALTGDPGEWAEWERSLAYPRAVRRPLQVVLESPGDPDRLEEALTADPLTSGNIQPLRRFAQLFSARERTREALGFWLEADGELLRLEALGERIRTRVEAEGPGGAEILGLLNEVSGVHRDLEGVDERFSDAITLWVSDLERWISRSLIVASLIFAFLGTLLMWVAGRRVRRSRAALARSEERFRQVTEAIREVFWLTDTTKSQMLYVSPGYERVWGRSVDGLLSDPESWMDPVHPEDRARVEAAVEGQSRGEYDVEYRIELPGGETRWIRDRAFPVGGPDGEVTRIAGIAEDITHRKELERELLQAGTVRAMAQLSGVVGHELNNLLTVVQSHAQLALSELPPESTAKEDLEAVNRAADSAADLARKLLSVSRQQLLVPRVVRLERLLHESREMIRAVLPDDAQLSLETPMKLPPVRVDPGYVREAVAALVAHVGAGRPEVVWVDLDREEAVQPLQVHGRDLPPGNYLRVRVGSNRDDGGAVDPKTLFAPLQVRDAINDGQVAFGLPAAQGILDQSGGGIRVGSDADPQGTRFVVFLPIWKEARPSTPRKTVDERASET